MQSIQISRPQARKWLFGFETWGSRCPKSFSDFKDREDFEKFAYEVIWQLDPDRYNTELLT